MITGLFCGGVVISIPLFATYRYLTNLIGEEEENVD